VRTGSKTCGQSQKRTSREILKSFTDNRTCPICAKPDGKRFGINDSLPIPAHPRCRCCALPVIKEGVKGKLFTPESEPTIMKSKAATKSKKEAVDKVHELQQSGTKLHFFKRTHSHQRHAEELTGLTGDEAWEKYEEMADEFLKKEISVYFEVVAEADGVAGFERARTYDADLIICDVLMPGMNGYEVTRKLKNEFSTSHIPIILLTAMGTTENKLEGVESGADAYVTKPFSLKLLLARMVQLIDQREKLREKYVNDPSIERPAIYTSDKDKQFLDKLQAIIEQELGNSEFTMEDFAARMKLGRTVFSKKVRGLTGHTPNEYFRIIRLKKAAELLLEGNYNVSEVSYKVGISDPLYFSRCFKTHYGVSPSVYLRGKEKEI